MEEATSAPQSFRPATKYRLSVGSNPSSRRSSLGLADDINTYNTNQNVFKEILVPRIGELTDAIMTLENNFSRLNEIHNNLVDFNESFGSFIYGLTCTSACSHFSGVPSNLESELRKLKRIQSLKAERDRLRAELKQLRVRNGSAQKEQDELTKNDKNIPKKKQFVEPLFRTSQVKQNVRDLRNMGSSAGVDSNIGGGDAIDNEDNSSEASFVVNPVRETGLEQLKNQGIADVAQRAGISGRTIDNKMRRKSILDTIRSGRHSYASTSNGTTVRQSLAPPRRNAAHAMTVTPRSNTTGVTVTRKASRSTSMPGREGGRVVKPTPGVTRRRTLENRPPFR